MVDVVRNGSGDSSARIDSPSPRSGGPSRAHEGPTVLRIVLGGQLRRRRETAGITREDAGHAIRASPAKISRLELGRVGFKERDVADLITLYGVVEAEERAEFLSLARQANTPGWWHQYSDLLETWFETYLGLEQAANLIRTYQLQFLPGLLQTREYCRAVVKLARDDDDEIDRRVDLRMQRQEVFLKDDGARLWVVVDEAALRRALGSTLVMRRQVERLLELNELPAISIQVAPLRFGGHAAAGGPFSILRFAEPDLPDVVYLEQLASALYLDRRADVERYAAVMDRLCAQVEQPHRTESILLGVRDEL